MVQGTGQLPLSRDDVREDGSKETDGGGGQGDRRRKRSSRSFVSSLTQTEEVVIHRAPPHTAAVELKHKNNLHSF